MTVMEKQEEKSKSKRKKLEVKSCDNKSFKKNKQSELL